MEYTAKNKVLRNRQLSTRGKSTKSKQLRRTLQIGSLNEICFRLRDGMRLEDTEPDVFQKTQTDLFNHSSSAPRPDFQYSTSSLAARSSSTNKERYCHVKTAGPVHPDHLTQPILWHNEESSHTNHPRILTQVNSSCEDLLHCSLYLPAPSSTSQPLYENRNDVLYEGYYRDNSEQEDTIIERENIFSHPVFQTPITYPDTNFSNQLLGLTTRIHALTAEMEFAMF